MLCPRRRRQGLSYVWKQPATPEEILAAEEARQGCPTISIGDDGQATEDSG
ncbi:MAG: ferredoxin [Verrucomicrobiota bacterium]